jgi:tetratricopeptide (TPR) repeat protein
MGTQPLVGRLRETAVLADVLGGTGGAGPVLLVLGDAGIGKSALLGWCRDRARADGRLLLAAVGVEPEAVVPFAGLSQLLAPVLDRADLLPRAERAVLLAAFGLADGPAPDPHRIGRAASDLLLRLAREQPVAVVADDVHWLDPETQQALVSLSHRAADAAVVVVAAMRTGHPGPFLTAGFPELVVDGVDDEAAQEIVTGAAPGLSPGLRARIVGEALGNPLALRELPAAAGKETRPASGLRPLALTARLEQAFAGRVAGLPALTRDALLVAAVDSAEEIQEILRAVRVLSGTPSNPAVFAGAQRAHLVRVHDGRVTFHHPLIRSAVIQSAGLSRAQAAHAALARVLDAEPYRQIRHRAAAILGPDDEVADALESCAVVAAGRGALLSAIADLERSAQLTRSSIRRGRRLLDAAEYGFGLGHAQLVDELVTEAVRTDLTDLDRARAEWLRELFDDGVPGNAPRVLELCAIAKRSAAVSEDSLALNLLLGASLRCWWADTGPEARRAVIETAHGLDPRTGRDARHIAVLAVAEPLGECAEVADRLDKACQNPDADADTLRMLGMAAHAIGDEPRAVELLDAAQARLRTDGRLALLSQVLSMQVNALLALGDLVRAAGAAEEGERLARETGQPIWRTGTLVCTSVRAALVGQIPEALQMAAEAEIEAGRRRLNDLLSCVQLARGLAFLATGRDRDAYRALRRGLDPDDVSFHRRESFGCLMFLADAAVRAGHREDAREVLDRLEEVGATIPSPILHVNLAYARAVLADDDSAEGLFLALLADDVATGWTLVQAKGRLAYGGWLRGQSRDRQATDMLREARAAFDCIGAVPWADRARCELAAAGAAVVWPQPGDAAWADVQSRWRAVADLAGEGLPGDAIARRLSLPVEVVDLYARRADPGGTVS